jgi:hypothetical protein
MSTVVNVQKGMLIWRPMGVLINGSIEIKKQVAFVIWSHQQYHLLIICQSGKKFPSIMLYMAVFVDLIIAKNNRLPKSTKNWEQLYNMYQS